MKTLENTYPAADQPQAIARFYQTVVAPTLKKKLGLVEPEEAQREAQWAAECLNVRGLAFHVCPSLRSASYDAETHAIMLPAQAMPLGSVYRAVAIADWSTDPSNLNGASGRGYLRALLSILRFHYDHEISNADWECAAIRAGVEVETSFTYDADVTFVLTEQKFAFQFWEIAS